MANTMPWQYYQSLHGDLGVAPPNTPGLINKLPIDNVPGYIQRFRVFIPPGTISTTLSIYEWGKQKVRARYKILPTSEDVYDAYNPAIRSLEELEAEDQLISENIEGKISIIYDPSDKIITSETAGWLYVYVGGGSYSSTYWNQFTVAVDADVYNPWYNSINWATQVEGVQTYSPGTTSPPNPSGNPTTYTSRTGHYGRADITSSSYYEDGSYVMMMHTYDPRENLLRVFIPPGTMRVQGNVLSAQYPGHAGVFRYKVQPDASTFTGQHPYKLSEIIDVNMAIYAPPEGDGAGTMPYIEDGFSPPMAISDSGWLYTGFDGYLFNGVSDNYLSAYSNLFSITVDAEKYNAWYDTYIKDEAGWAKYVESVETYSVPMSDPRVVTLTNTTASECAFTVTYPDGFSGDWAGGTLAVSESKSINVIFHPTEPIDYSGYIVFSSPNGDCQCLVRGTGSSTSDTKYPVRTIVVTNQDIVSYDVKVECPEGFSVDWTGGLLAAGESVTVTVTFTPTEERTYTGSIIFSSTAGTTSVEVTGSASVTATSPVNSLEAMSEEYAAQAVSKGLALENITTQLKKYTDMQALVKGISTDNASVKLFTAFHLAKVPGEYGSYGLDNAVTKLTALKTSLENDISFCQTAAVVYSSLSKGIDPGTVEAPKGYVEVSAKSTFSNDMDSPASKAKLLAGPDYHLQNRPYVNSAGEPDSNGAPLYPDYKKSKVGDMVFVNGMLEVYYGVTKELPDYTREYKMTQKGVGFRPVNMFSITRNEITDATVLEHNVFGFKTTVTDGESTLELKIGDGATKWPDLPTIAFSAPEEPLTGGQ